MTIIRNARNGALRMFLFGYSSSHFRKIMAGRKCMPVGFHMPSGGPPYAGPRDSNWKPPSVAVFSETSVQKKNEW